MIKPATTRLCTKKCPRTTTAMAPAARIRGATVAIPTGLTAKLIIWYPHYAWLLLSVYLTVALVALVVVGSMAHVRRVSPVVKRTLELIDGAMIAAIIPMLLWITGVYDTVRNIRF